MSDRDISLNTKISFEICDLICSGYDAFTSQTSCCDDDAVCFDKLWPFFGCVCGVRSGVAPKQWSSYSAIIHLVQRQAAAALLTLSLWVAGYNSRWTAVDTGPHSHIPPGERTWESERKGCQIRTGR